MEFDSSIKFSILEQTEGKVVGKMPITVGNKNPYGVVHVGEYFVPSIVKKGKTVSVVRASAFGE